MIQPGGMIARELVCMAVRLELPSGGSPANTFHNWDKYIPELRQLHFTIKTNTFHYWDKTILVLRIGLPSGGSSWNRILPFPFINYLLSNTFAVGKSCWCPWNCIHILKPYILCYFKMCSVLRKYWVKNDLYSFMKTVPAPGRWSWVDQKGRVGGCKGQPGRTDQ